MLKPKEEPSRQREQQVCGPSNRQANGEFKKRMEPSVSGTQ